MGVGVDVWVWRGTCVCMKNNDYERALMKWKLSHIKEEIDEERDKRGRGEETAERKRKPEVIVMSEKLRPVDLIRMNLLQRDNFLQERTQ